MLIELPGPETRASGRRRPGSIDVYIAGCALERDPEWEADGYFFNTHFIIAPTGEIIHKYRKITTATHYELSLSPHDIYSRWIERYGDSLASFLPVTETEIGRIGTITCMDGHFPGDGSGAGRARGRSDPASLADRPDDVASFGDLADDEPHAGLGEPGLRGVRLLGGFAGGAGGRR